MAPRGYRSEPRRNLRRQAANSAVVDLLLARSANGRAAPFHISVPGQRPWDLPTLVSAISPRGGSRAPFVHQHFHEIAAHNRTGSKANHLAVGGFVPVADRHTVRAFVDKTIYRVDQRLKVIARASHACGPDDPIGFRISLAAVQRQPKFVLL